MTFNPTTQRLELDAYEAEFIIAALKHALADYERCVCHKSDRHGPSLAALLAQCDKAANDQMTCNTKPGAALVRALLKQD